jgi:hypothetical protein
VKVQTFKVEGRSSCNTCRAASGSITLLLDRPLTKQILASLIATGQYAEATHMTKAGILYVENRLLVVQGPFGKKQLQIKCKFSFIKGKTAEDECEQSLHSITTLLEGIE